MKAFRIILGFGLAFVFVVILGLTILLAVGGFTGELPGYVVYFWSAVGVVLCSIRMAIGKKDGAPGVFVTSLGVLLGLVLDPLRCRDLGAWMIYGLPAVVGVGGSIAVWVWERSDESGLQPSDSWRQET